MSSAILQSNSQSALISTLNSTSSASIDPFIYSLNKRVPAHGCQWTKLHPTNTQANSPGQTMNFDLTKSGFTRTLVLDVTLQMGNFDRVVTATGAKSSSVPPNWCWGLKGGAFLNLIDNITIESSSRRLGTMTKHSLIAAMSDLAEAPRRAVQRAWGCTFDPSTGPSIAACPETGYIHAQIPLLFSYFGACDLSLSTGFVEPCRVCVTWAKDFQESLAASMVYRNVYGGANGDALGYVLGAACPISTIDGVIDTLGNGFNMDVSIADCHLIVDNRLLPSPMTDATLQANYGSGPLTELVYNYSEQPSKPGLLPETPYTEPGTIVSVPITDTSVATDIYVIITANDLPTNLDSGWNFEDRRNQVALQGTPLPAVSISFTASGQNVIEEMPAQYFGEFSRRTMGDGFWETAGSADCDRAGLLDSLYSDSTPAGDINATCERVTIRQGTTILGGSGTRDCMNTAFIYRLQFGLSASKLFDSNGVSLRELNNPQVNVRLPRVASADSAATPGDHVFGNHGYVPFDLAGAPVTVRCIVRSLGLQTTDSSSGRVVSVLSN